MLPCAHVQSMVDATQFRRRLESLEAWLWHEGAAQHRLAPPEMDVLAQRVIDLSDLYTTERDMLGRLPLRQGHLLAKVLYFLCADAPKPHLVLREVAERHGWPRPPREVVDIGCGVGATSAGFILSLAESDEPIRLTGVDRDPAALEVWTSVVERCAAIAGVRVEPTAVVGDAGTFAVGNGVDLVLCQATLNELLAPRGGSNQELEHDKGTRAIVAGWARRAITVLIEPALRILTRPLHALRDALVSAGDIRVLAPCPHQRACPMLAVPRDWCHEIRPWRTTPRVAEIDRATKRRDERVKYSFVVLAASSGGGAAPIAEPASTRFAGRLVSDALVTKGKVERFVCGGDGVLRRLRVLDRERSRENAMLATAPRGAMVTIEGLGESERVAPTVRVARSGSV